jgi:hypothetical protein
MNDLSVRRVSITVALLAALLSAACVPPASAPPAAPIPSSSYSAREQAVRLGMKRFAGAVRSGDVAGVILSFDANSEVVAFKGDTLRGSAAARFVVDLAKDSVHQLALVPGKVSLCLGGDALESDGTFYGPRDEQLQIDAGHYAVLWDPRISPAVIRRIVMTFDDRSLTDATPCTPELSILAAQQTWTLTLDGAVPNVGNSATANQLSATLVANGFANNAYSAGTGPAYGGFPRANTSHAPMVTAGLRYRLTHAVSAEVQFGMRPSEHAAGFEERCDRQPCERTITNRTGDSTLSSHRYLEINSVPFGLSTLLQYQLRRFRFSGGPSVVLNNWSVFEEKRTLAFLSFSVLNPSTDHFRNSVWSEVEPGSGRTVRSLGATVGVTGEVAAFLPTAPSITLEAFLRGSILGDTSLPAVENYQNNSVAMRLVQIGMALGFGWK